MKPFHNELADGQVCVFCILSEESSLFFCQRESYHFCIITSRLPARTFSGTAPVSFVHSIYSNITYLNRSRIFSRHTTYWQFMRFLPTSWIQSNFRRFVRVLFSELQENQHTTLLFCLLKGYANSNKMDHPNFLKHQSEQ